jgi:phosphatidylserine decarboxylase
MLKTEGSVVRIHRAGYSILLLAGIALFLFKWLIQRFAHHNSLARLICWLSVGLYGLLVYFFRVPTYIDHPSDQSILIAPAHGKVIAIEQVFEREFLKRDCVRISIYLSLFNMHLSTAPTAAQIVVCQHTPGKHLLAFDPQASVLNERQSIVLQLEDQSQILMQLIAGTVARRICCYVRAGQAVQQGQEIGFIRFGSRVDVYVPADWEVLARVGQRVQLATTTIARRTE